MKTKLCILSMAALVIALAMAGCKGNNNNPEEPNTPNTEEVTISNIEETDGGRVTYTYSDGAKMGFLIRIDIPADYATVTYYFTPSKPEEKLYDAVIPSEVTWHGKKYPVVNVLNGVFEGNKHLKSVTSQENLTTLESKCFCACSALELVSVSCVDEIPQSCFMECSSLATIKIGKRVTSIKSYAYLSCTAIKDFTIQATEPPTLGENVFTEGVKFTLHVPSGSITKYTATEWSKYAASIVAIE